MLPRKTVKSNIRSLKVSLSPTERTPFTIQLYLRSRIGLWEKYYYALLVFDIMHYFSSDVRRFTNIVLFGLWDSLVQRRSTECQLCEDNAQKCARKQSATWFLTCDNCGKNSIMMLHKSIKSQKVRTNTIPFSTLTSSICFSRFGLLKHMTPRLTEEHCQRKQIYIQHSRTKFQATVHNILKFYICYKISYCCNSGNMETLEEICKHLIIYSTQFCELLISEYDAIKQLAWKTLERVSLSIYVNACSKIYILVCCKKNALT